MGQVISVLVPVFNGARTIGQTLRSLRSQTHTDLEILVSDNASSDETVGIVRAHGAQDARIRLIRNDVNVGYCRNIRRAAEAASSDIIAIYHADDVYHPTIVAKELALLISDSSIGGVFAHPAVFTRSVRSAVRKRFYSGLSRRLPFDQSRNAIVAAYDELRPVLLEHGNVFACPSFMTRRSLFLHLGGFTDRFPSNEDFELWLRYLQVGWKLGIVNEHLLYYRMSSSHASAHWGSRPELAVMYTVIDALIDAQCPLSMRERKLYRRNRAVGFARAALNAFLLRDSRRGKELLRKSREEARLPLRSPFGLVQRLPRTTGALWPLVAKVRALAGRANRADRGGSRGRGAK